MKEIPSPIAFIVVGMDYLFRYMFRKNIFFFYQNKEFSIFSLYLYSLIINLFFIFGLNLLLNE